MKAISEPEESVLAELKARLAEAEETLRAIYHGEVDAVVVTAPDGDQIYTLRGAETPYRLLVETINEGALTLLADGTILFCNNRFAQMVNRPMEQITGGTWTQFFSETEQDNLQKLLQRARHNRSKAEFALASRGGARRTVEISAHPLKLDQLDCFSVLVADITERKRSEQALLRAKEDLEQRVQDRTRDLTRSNELLRVTKELLQAQAVDLERQVAERTAHLQTTIRSLETLCYNMAHDLRAPNRTMQGFAELLLANYADAVDATGQDYLRRIAAAASRNDRLILDMLSYGRIGHVALPCSPQNLEVSLQSALENLAPGIHQSKARIEVRRPLAEVWANALALEEILTNILGNAVKFVPGGVTPEVTVWTEEREGLIRVHVKDNGIGIPAEHHHRVFNLFERLHGGEKYPGTGIGLAIVEKAVERLGGCIGVESEPGKGSCFWIDLPKHSPR